MTNTAELNNRVHLADLMCTPEFQTLTAKAQVFCAAYIASGMTTGRYDHIAAASVAYKTSRADVVGAEMLGNRKIKAVLDIHFKRSGFDSTLVDLRSLLKRARRRNSDLARLVPELQRALIAFEKYTAKANADV